VALATKSQGGVVIAQVERVAAAGTIHPHQIKVPGALVDAVVVAKPENHHQSNDTVYEPAFTGELRRPMDSITALELNERKIIARRGAFELGQDVLVNLGVGVPDGIPGVAKEEGLADQITLTVESGPYGGMPAPGMDFGATYNPTAILEQTNMFDLYDSGMLDVVYLGLAQTDEAGNVNVSKFGPRFAGCGGFINITQNAKKVVFCGTMTAGGLKVKIQDGRLKIVEEGKTKKFCKNVDHITFSGDYARESGQQVIYMTERAVFELTPQGMMLTEIAPGVDLQKDVLAQIDFAMAVSPNLKLMDERIFLDQIMGIKDEVLAK
jgi:propionate CoA-transferase